MNALSKSADSDAMTRWRLDRYEVLGEIAHGGMGTVLLARLAGTGGFSRLFAIKMLHAHLAADGQFVNMLLDEARLASRIHHSNVVSVFDVCHGVQGLYVVMEYIDGVPFSRIMKAPELSYEQRLRVAVPALLGVLAGLEAAHNLVGDDGAPLGLVHRDVSPQNVLVGLDGVGRIADFGIAHAAARRTHTEPGMIKGTVAYMAPENARGERIDRRADLFSVGVMLWECLAGERLFRAENDAATLSRLLGRSIPPPSACQGHSGAALDAVCLMALDRDPAGRYATARDMAAALAGAADQGGWLVPPFAVADLVQSCFGQELDRRQAAIRACGVAPPRPPSLESPIETVTPATPAEGASVAALGCEGESGSLVLDISVDTAFGHIPPRARPPQAGHAAAIAAGLLVASFFAGALLTLRVAMLGAPVARAPLVAAQLPSPPPARPAVVVAPALASCSVGASVRSDDHRTRHMSHSKTHGHAGARSPRGDPALEHNPYF
jgi:serine/threonine protein kinase